MRITIAYSAQLKQAAGTEAEVVDTGGGASVRDVLTAAAQRHGEPLRSLLLDGQGALRGSLLICVGDRQVSSPAGVVLKDGDEVLLLAPIAGG